MGDMADYYRDMSREWEELHSGDYYNGIHYKELLREYLKGKLMWVTKENEEILVGEMQNQHIINSRNYLIKKDSANQSLMEWIDIFNMEIKKRNI
jgi:hypothetical protein